MWLCQTQMELVISSKADSSDMERRALKAEVDASLRTQAGDLYTILRAKSDETEFKVRWVTWGQGCRGV